MRPCNCRKKRERRQYEPIWPCCHLCNARRRPDAVKVVQTEDGETRFECKDGCAK